MKQKDELGRGWVLHMNQDHRSALLTTPSGTRLPDGAQLVSTVVHFLDGGRWELGRPNDRAALPSWVKAELSRRARVIDLVLARDPRAYGEPQLEPMSDRQFTDAVHALLIEPVRTIPFPPATAAVLKRMLERTGRGAQVGPRPVEVPRELLERVRDALDLATEHVDRSIISLIEALLPSIRELVPETSSVAAALREEPTDPFACPYQTAYGLPWEEYCGKRKDPGQPYCWGHIEEVAEFGHTHGYGCTTCHGVCLRPLPQQVRSHG